MAVAATVAANEEAHPSVIGLQESEIAIGQPRRSDGVSLASE